MNTKHLFIALVLLLSFAQNTQAQECGIVYISPTGANSGIAGTRATPASLDYGLTLFSLSAKRLWLATGTYTISTTIVLPDSITMEGGFNSSSWVKSNTSVSTIHRDNQNLITANNALIAIGGINANAFRLQDLTITVDNAPGNGNSVYGIYLNACTNYNITRCFVTTGNGSAGATGTPGTNGTAGGNGGNGVPGGAENASYPGGAGGTGANAGGAGATVTSYDNVNGGTAGSGPSPGTAGTGGTGPSCSAGCFFGPPSCSSTTPGVAGGNGGNGTTGGNGTAGGIGSIVGGYYVIGSAGGNGTSGASGSGGGGGGGGGGRQENGTDQWGGSGGGGGGGGTAGTGGTGGTGGGGSFAVFLFNNGTGGIIQDCSLNPGAGGAGGVGGAGGTGATGGVGGNGGAAGVCSNGVGGKGGNGGNGGNGGTGGSGTTGPSVALSQNGGTAITNLGIASVPGNPPVITVDNKGCTRSEVLFSTTTSGTWNFGAGAVPATANGSGPFSVVYYTLGRKTVTFSGTSFTEYVDIFSAGPAGSTITPANATTTLGCPNTYSTTLSGSNYQWLFGSSANPDTVQGAGSQTVNNIYFGATGTHTIKVWVTTSCCGRVLDSTTVTVNPSVNNVTLTANPSTFCAGTSSTFTITETYTGYVFSVNGTVAQSGPSNTYTTTTLQQGDSVVAVGLAATCFTNPSTTIYPTVNPIPAISITSSDADNIICAGQSVTYTATPAGYANYQFFNGATSLQSGASNTFTTTTLTAGNSITVVATNLNCPSLPSNAIVTTVNALPPTITLTSSDLDNTICAGDNVTFTVTPAGIANYDFSVAGSSVQSSAANTFSTTTLSNGNTINVIPTTAAGCVGTVSNTLTFTVNPIPTATLTASNDSICPGTSIVFTASPSGNSNYQFFNGATSVQNSAVNTFSTTALTTGNNITVVATNLGCSSPASNALSIYLYPIPTVTITSSDADNTICAGDNVTFTASPAGLANYQFFGNITSLQNGAGNTYSTTTLTSADTIRVVATNFGCPSLPSNGIVTTVNPIPTATLAASPTTICAGDNVTYTITPAGNDNYEFFLNAVSVQSNASNTYSSAVIISTDAVTAIATDLGCASPLSNNVSITVNPIPTVSLNASDTNICAGDNVIFTATPSGYNNYEFFDGATSLQSSASNTFSSTTLASGNNITVVATNLNCPSPASNAVVVVVNPLPGIITLTSSDPDNTICAGDNVTFTASPSGIATYDFSINGTSVQSGAANTFSTSTLVNSDAVTVIATTNAGCVSAVSNSISNVVNPIPSVSLTASNDSICPGSNVVFTATPSGNNNYQFFNGAIPLQNGAANTFSTSALTSGNSITVITTNLGCSSPASNALSIYIYPAPTVSITSSDPNNTICAGDNVTFTATTAGLANYQFFSNATSVQNGASNTYATTSLTTTDTIRIVATNFGCPSLPSNGIVTVVNPIPVVTISANPTTICAGDNVTFTASPSALSNYQFFINGAAIQSGASNTYSSTTITTADIITVIGTNLGCVSAVSSGASVTVNPKPVVSLSSSVSSICQGQSVTFTAAPAGLNNYEFFNGATSLQSGASNTYTTTSLSAGNTITVVGTNLGCASAASNAVSITVNALPVVTINGTNLICRGQSTTLTASGGISYLWNTSDTINPVTYSPTTTTNYSVTATDNKGCTNTASFHVSVIQPVPVNAGSDVVNCNGTGVQMNAGSGFATYVWTPSAGLSNANIANPIANPTVTTTYHITYTDANGCIANDSITVTPSSVTATAGPDITINYGNGNPLAASGGTNYLWTPSTGLSCTTCQSPIANPENTTIYTLVVTDDNGCSATDSVKVEVIITNDIFIPDAFSPNADTYNDVLYVRGNTIAEMHFSVFDRWGNKVFESTDKTKGWDGQYKGSNAEPGVYFYYVKATIVNGNIVNKKGDVTLVR